MRRLFNKLLKKEKKLHKDLDPKIFKSKEFQALQNLNIIMNLYDNIEKLGYDSLDGDEMYLQARFSAHAFMTSLVETLAPPVVESETVDASINTSV